MSHAVSHARNLISSRPNNPVALQLFYFRVYANSAALKAMGIDANTPDPANIKIEKDAQGQLTGALNGGASIGLLRSKLGRSGA